MVKNIVRISTAISSTVICFVLPIMAQAQDRAFNNPLAGGKPQILPITTIVGRVIQTLLGISGLLAVIFIIIGGIQIISARGNASGVEKGQSTVVWAVLGTIIAFAGYIVMNFILQQAQTLL